MKLIGATSHFVTEELDSGPIIEQMVTHLPTSFCITLWDCQFSSAAFSINLFECDFSQVESVSHRDNLRSFVQKSEDLEKKCLTKAIKSYCELRVLPYGTNKTVVF